MTPPPAGRSAVLETVDLAGQRGERALFEHEIVEAVMPAGDGSGETRWAGADDEDVADRHSHRS